jgi:aspartate kinase
LTDADQSAPWTGDRHFCRPSSTLITEEAHSCENPVKAIAYKKGITIVNITSTRMLMAHGFLKKISEICNLHRAAVDVVSKSEVSVSLTLDETSALWDIVMELKKYEHQRNPMDTEKKSPCPLSL